jgi:hypothetical protein
MIEKILRQIENAKLDLGGKDAIEVRMEEKNKQTHR